MLCQAHEVLALEIMHVLMENPTNDSIELAIAFLKECGQRLTEVSSRGITGLLNFKQILAVCNCNFLCHFCFIN